MSSPAAPVRRRARLEDVAREAGVSKSTASRVLSGSSTIAVRPETRERIERAALRLDYAPHHAASGLKRAQTGAVGLIIPSLATVAYTRIVRGAAQRGLERDLAVLLLEDLVPEEADEVFVRLVQAGRIDGMIVASARPGHPLLASLHRLHVPHVFVNRAVPGSGRNVIMDDERASGAALDHLAALGHTRIGHVSGPRAIDPAARRSDAFAKHAARHGLAAAPIAEGEFTEAGGAAAAGALLDGHPEVTALFTSSLGQTIGTLHAAAERGLRVPADVSVLGYDDMPLADYLHPPATVVRMPFDDLGAAAVDALTEQLRGGEPQDVVVETIPEVVVRASTAPPPARPRRGRRA